MRRAIAVSLLLSTGCATGAALELEAETMRSRAKSAREGGAYDCAPVELAKTEANLDFLEIELSEGNSIRAADHRRAAEAALNVVLEKTKGCRPAEPPPPPPRPKDRDGDGILDENDACPDHAGPKELAGCPDRDGDRIPDKSDKCPDQPEDFDKVEDDDGCPEIEDRDGDGILDPDDKCPTVPGVPEKQGCPITDRDNDGIPDATDKCPDVPEDLDRFEDEDGCPDPDNDGDGIPDTADKCPDLPETRNGFEDTDGCPDINPQLVVVNREIGKIEIKQKVFFDFGKATIQPRSYKLLNEVAEALKANPTMAVAVEGHTDSVGSNETNQRLSQKRSESVRDYLIGQGITAERLTAVGYGEEKPIDTNQTAAGREKNRRVEFTITKE